MALTTPERLRRDSPRAALPDFCAFIKVYDKDLTQQTASNTYLRVTFI